jgi:hypothetical protein
MPLKRCQKDGKSGWKWGDSGKCYTGEGGKKKAIAQGVAIGHGKLEEHVQLVERVYSPEPKVDKELGVIHAVKILGRNSKNKRTYSQKALESAVKLYQGVHVHLDHPDRKKPNAPRSMNENVGRLSNPRLTEDGVYGDLEFLKTHPVSPQICERAERMPESIGLSHNADGQVRRCGETSIVEELTGVRSVDIVLNPATTNSLFESEQEEDMSTTAPLTEDGSGDQAFLVEQAFMESIIGVTKSKELDIPTKVGRYKTLLEQQAAATNAVTGEVEEKPPAIKEEITERYEEPSDPEQAKVMEELQRLRDEKAEHEAMQKAQALLEQAKCALSSHRISALARTVDPAERNALVAEWKAVDHKSRRPSSSAPINLTEDQFGTYSHMDPKEFAASLR